MAGDQNFSAAIDAWVAQTQERCTAVFKTAAQSVIEDVIRRTPVDTGFLRHSLTVSTKDMPLIDRAAKPAEGVKYLPEPYTLVLVGAKIGETINVGFVAVYAPDVEYGARNRAGVGMIRLASQAWPQHVAAAVALAKATVAGGR